jgi:hypothetical protein
MREHQIIINLKPEHYQELERLSRASGARSVSIFVKERILASLGIGGAGAAGSLAGNANLAAVTADIRRLHRDLQVFVSESLSGKDFGYSDGEQSPLQGALGKDEQFVGALGSDILDPSELAPAEQNAQTTGSNGESASHESELSDAASAASTAVPQSVLGAASLTRGAGKPGGLSIGPAASSFPVSNFYGEKGAGSQPNIHFPIPASQNGAAANQPRDATVPDDLEELAERAFAISPRLGAIEEIDDDKPMFSDPLDELLGELEGGEKSEGDRDGDGDDAESFEDGEAEAEGEQSGDAPDEPDNQDTLDDESDVAPAVAEGDAETDDGSSTDSQSKEVSAAAASAGASAADPTVADASAADSTAAKQEVGPQSEEQSESRPTDPGHSASQNPPPISGGPPPRRRRT